MSINFVIRKHVDTAISWIMRAWPHVRHWMCCSAVVLNNSVSPCAGGSQGWVKNSRYLPVQGSSPADVDMASGHVSMNYAMVGQ